MDTASIGAYSEDVEATLADLKRRNITGGIWHKEHSIWKPVPAEITNRLGWLTVTGLMRGQVSKLQSFAGEVREAGFKHVVLLGMGGSSLGPEVLRQTFGSAAGHPELIVLDSTIPASLQAVIETVNPAHTLFLFSSKSGTTIEPNSLFQYFQALVTSAVGKEKAGGHFVAITDADTPLADLAFREKFRRSFINPADIGGRYSVLSYFGLVPAVLTGIDIKRLLDSAERMQERCSESKSVRENPGAWLGAAMGALALLGRDKLTLLTSPSVDSFGLWVEQLIAESTGKEGKGIVPIIGEPIVKNVYYGDDRLFICLRLSGDDNSVVDTAIESIRASGLPLVILEIEDKYDLGAEFFRWEFATAVAGAILGIQPFDQPDVQAAKQATESMLQAYMNSGELPRLDVAGSFTGLLAKARGGDYLTFLAYVQQTPEMDGVISDLRRRVVERYRVATTFGYGPRYLHSTGQLHKGGPNTGLFLMLTSEYNSDIPIPGWPYSFGVLADAQALGDLQALQSTGRRLARVHLRAGDAAGISRLLGQME